MSHRLIALLCAALATTMIAAGCGGDDDEEATSSEDFVAQVTAACEDASTELAGVTSSLQQAVLSGSEDELATAVEDDLVPAFSSLQSDLEAITPPEEDADSYDQLLSNTDESISLLEDDPVAYFEASSGEQNEISDQAQELEDESDQLAADLGIPENCGEPSGTTGPTGAQGSG